MHEKAIDFYLAAYEYIKGQKVMEDMKLNTVFNLTKTVLTFIREMFERNIPLLSGQYNFKFIGFGLYFTGFKTIEKSFSWRVCLFDLGLEMKSADMS